MRNIIFDWSGTLVDDLPPVFAATNSIFKELNEPELTLEDFRREFRLPFEGFYRQFLPNLTMVEVNRLYWKYFVPIQDDVQLLPHAQEFLDFCKATGRRIFLLSSITKDHFDRQASRLGVLDYFEQAYVEILDKRATIGGLMSEHQLDPKETMFIGDMTHDIETAHHGGVTSVATLTGYDPVEKLLTAKPGIIVQNLGELQKLLASIPMYRFPVSTVGAAIFHESGEVLLIKTHKWSSLWGIPGGKIKRGESAVEALRREILEETGLILESIDFVMVQDCIDSPEFQQPAHFLLLNYSAVTKMQEVTLNTEAEEFKWMSLEQAMTMPLNTPTRVLLERISGFSDKCLPFANSDAY